MYHAGDLHQLWATARETHLTFNIITFMASLLLLALVAATYVFGGSRPVYLINFHCYKPPAQCVLGCFLLLNVLHAPQSSIQAPAYLSSLQTATLTLVEELLLSCTPPLTMCGGGPV